MNIGYLPDSFGQSGPNANDFKRFWNYKKHILAGNE